MAAGLLTAASSQRGFSSVARHDLSTLDAPLRSHGGLSEQRVPVVLNRRTRVASGARVRNFDAFDLALNRVV